MKKTSLNILFFSTFPPRKCGIANYTRDLSETIKNGYPSTLCHHLAVSNLKNGYTYPPSRNPVVLEINQFCLKDYLKAAEYANYCNADLVNIQHEFGIFGGFDGCFLVKFLEKVKIPKVINWHTMPIITEAKRRERRLVLMKQITSFCQANINITQSSRKFVIDQKIAPAAQSFYIPHGAPTFDLNKINQFKKKLKLKNKTVLGTQGMISDKKGLEFVIEALPQVVKKNPQVIYLIIGTSHFGASKTYYQYLQQLVKQKGLSKFVKFINRYLSLEEVVEYISVVDIHLTPYLTSEQISSGVLCYAVAAGKYCISTPFTYAREVLAKGRGVLVPFKNSQAIAQAINEALQNPDKLKTVQQKTYRYGQQFLWEKVAKQYLDVFQKVIKN